MEQRLTLHKPKIRKSKCRSWISQYKCICGNVTEVLDTAVRNNRITSCECVRKIKCAASCKSLFTTHGLSKTKTYKVWGDMIAKCTLPSSSPYPYYGGRGITVCDRWKTFVNFLKDMGECPIGKSLDRIDNNGNYEPNNCRWATKSQQMKNRRPRGTCF